jgi:hypothetical protein
LRCCINGFHLQNRNKTFLQKKLYCKITAVERGSWKFLKLFNMEGFTCIKISFAITRFSSLECQCVSKENCFYLLQHLLCIRREFSNRDETFFGWRFQLREWIFVYWNSMKLDDATLTSLDHVQWSRRDQYQEISIETIHLKDFV